MAEESVYPNCASIYGPNCYHIHYEGFVKLNASSAEIDAIYGTAHDPYIQNLVLTFESYDNITRGHKVVVPLKPMLNQIENYLVKIEFSNMVVSNDADVNDS
jgi:hypothetical protein